MSLQPVSNTPSAAAGRYDDGVRPRPMRGGKPRLLTCDQRPGEQHSAREWAKIAGIPSASTVYNSAFKGYAAHGFYFRFADGKPPKGKSAGKPPVVQSSTPDALAVPPLNGAQIAQLISSVDPSNIASVVDWALGIRQGYVTLMAALSGKVRLAIVNGEVRPVA